VEFFHQPFLFLEKLIAMFREDLFYCGHLSKTTGTKGVLVFVRENVSEDLLFEQKALFVNLPPDYVPFMIRSVDAISDNRYHIRFRDVDSPEQAEMLSGQEVFIPVKELPDEALQSFHGIEGFTVVDEEQGKLGAIVEVLENPAHEILVMSYKGDEVLIPVTESIVLGLDPEEKVIRTQLPDGLLDLNQKGGETD
jgi:16S rRNA processing protein RimM